MAYDLIGQLLIPDEKLVRMLCLIHEAVVVVRDKMCKSESVFYQSFAKLTVVMGLE